MVFSVEMILHPLMELLAIPADFASLLCIFTDSRHPILFQVLDAIIYFVIIFSNQFSTKLKYLNKCY